MNLWEDATHQITFDDGKNWTNVILEDGYYLACSDLKHSWPVSRIPAHKVVARPVGNDVPRTLNGWPAVTPQEMTDEQVRREANRWRITAMSTGAGTVGHNEWTNYCEEYSRRGLISPDAWTTYEELQCQHLWVGWDHVEVCELCEAVHGIPPDPAKRPWWRFWR
jgi:hypothetical protein